MHKKLGGDTAGTAGPNCSKGYSIPYDVMLSNKTRGEVGGGAAAGGLAGHLSAGSEHLFSFASLVFLGFYFLLSLLYFSLFLRILLKNTF